MQDTQTEELTPTPPSFKLALRDYQQQSLTWMNRLEGGLSDHERAIGNVLISEYSSIGYDFLADAFFDVGNIDESAKIKGGVLADVCLSLYYRNGINN